MIHGSLLACLSLVLRLPTPPPALGEVVYAYVGSYVECRPCESGIACEDASEEVTFDDQNGSVSGSIYASAACNPDCSCDIGGSGASLGWGFDRFSGGIGCNVIETSGAGAFADMSVRVHRRCYSYGYSYEEWIGAGTGSGYLWLDPGGSVKFVSLAADIDGNEIVDAGDLKLVLANWGVPEVDVLSDVDLDGVVGPIDLVYVLSAWGTWGEIR